MKLGTIVVVRFPFSDLENTKKRPALILKVIPYTSKLTLYQIAMITSKVDSPDIQGDYLIRDWKQSGLLHPSKLRLSKISTIEGELVQLELGSLSKIDKLHVNKALKTHFEE